MGVGALATGNAAVATDSTAPWVSLTSPAAGTTWDETITFAGTAGRASGDNSSVTVRLFKGSSATGTPVLTKYTSRFDGVFSKVVATNLAAGTYTALAEQGDASGNWRRSTSTFTIAPTMPARIVAAGDIASCSSSGDEATAKLLDRSYGTVLTVGDNAYEDGTASEFTSCYSPSWGRHRARTEPALGDHEFGSSTTASAYFDYFGAVTTVGARGKGWYSRTIGEWHVVTLNANCDIVSCAAGSEQEKWLRADLAAHPARCTLAVLSTPLYSSGSRHGGSSAVRPLVKALLDHKADVMLSGDDHVYERFAPQNEWAQAKTSGIRQFVVGTGGKSLYGFGTPKANSQVRYNATFGVLALDLSWNKYTWSYKPVSGSFKDTGTTYCS